MAIILGFSAPLTAILLLLINIGTDALPAIALSVDYNETNTLKQKPRTKHNHMLAPRFATHFISTGVVIGVIAFASYLSVIYTNGWTPNGIIKITELVQTKAITAAFVALVMLQFFNTFNASVLKKSIFTWRPHKHLLLISSGLFTLILLYLITSIKALQAIFGTTSLSLKLWLTITGLSFSIIIINEIFKSIFYGRRSN